MISKRLLVIVFVLLNFSLFAQQLNTSPFSRYGIGELNSVESSHYFGWSNVSVAFSDPQYININNPASYAGFVKHNPLFDVSLSGKSALYKSNYNDNETTSTGNNFGLNNMFLGLPISKNWGMVIGIIPYSSKGYEVSSSTTLDSNTAVSTFTGDGSVNKLLIGNGFNLINRGDSTKFSAGFNVAYVFGNLERLSTVTFSSPNTYNSRIQYRTAISGLSYQAGLQYYKLIRGANNNKFFLRLGANYYLNSNLGTRNDFYAYSFVNNFGVQELAKDTLAYGENEAGTLEIPQKISIGLGFGKNKNDQRRWDLGIEYSVMDWTEFQESNFSNNQSSLPLGPSSTIAIGYRIIPNLDWSNSNKSIFSKSTYSFGFHQTKSSILINDIGLLNNGINFGLSVPLLSSRSFSRMNLGVELGRLGDLTVDEIEENYIKFAIGFTMAPDTRYDRWFRKRKYD